VTRRAPAARLTLELTRPFLDSARGLTERAVAFYAPGDRDLSVTRANGVRWLRAWRLQCPHAVTPMKTFLLALALPVLVAACGDGEAACRDCRKTTEPDGLAEPAISAREMEQELDEIEREIATDGGP
jgi:hypothetical protein